MLDTNTKRKIDSVRQILVGKVPDPKAQVEQITTALIYKFMDDMDKEARELGGKEKFFTERFEKYSWSKLLDKRYSGQERLDLYTQAITNMSKNPHIPQLFRDIFKDAFLPYRDPETLYLFLKEINSFSYDHSEDLGDAFEYLLSVLGSQGDAGQFRTPRHIIDFIVEVVDPKKNETVLDPACGTAGFLISAFKHIRKHNSSNFKLEKEKTEEKLPEGETVADTVLAEKAYRGDSLTPSEREKLMQNFVGYDISPDMVKLSLVNMYLHGFSEPRIFEYDTLTSEKHWGEQFDVIMANPPFMSPKGGIRPHKRFSVDASRSEVLFVDYIIEHLSLKGRAGIIVPEGIIFKTENAYKQLRQMLVEDGLFAVVSLPSGVFNPYAGVKTSILFFDNQLAKKTDEILFVKIENDGYDLGAQRRKIDANDLPVALYYLNLWQETLRSGGKKVKLKGRKQWDHGIWVKKTKIAESGDYNLTGEWYRESDVDENKKWLQVELGNEEYFHIESGGTPDSKNMEYWNGGIAWATLADLPAGNRLTEVQKTKRTITDQGLKKSSANYLPENSVLVSSRATIGRIGIAKIPLATNQGFKNIVIKDFSKVDPIYLANVLTQKVDEMKRLGVGGTYKEVSKSNFSKIKIPIPPLKVQKEIVEQIEVKQNAINHAKEVIKNLERERRYFDQELRRSEDVEYVKLGKLFDMQNGRAFKQSEWKSSGVPIIRIANLNSNESGYNYYDGAYDKKIEISRGDLLFSWSGTRGTSFGPHLWTRDKGILNQHIFKFVPKKANIVDLNFAYRVLLGIVPDIESKAHGAGGLVHVTKSELQDFQIPLPPLEVQKKLVAEAEKEEEIIASNRNLIQLMEQKISNILWICRFNNEVK